VDTSSPPKTLPAVVAELTATDATFPASSDVTLADLAAAEGTSALDTDLTTIATADYSLATTDFESYPPR
jgi:hypothetical protein